MDGPTLFLQFVALMILGISIFLKDEDHMRAMYALGLTLGLSMLYNAVFICHCVHGIFGAKCPK